MWKWFQLSLIMRVILSFALIITIIAAVTVYNLQRVEQIKSQISEQNKKTENKRLALELKQKAQQLNVMATGLALSGDKSVEGQYEIERKHFLALVDQVGAEANTREQRKWKAYLQTASVEFANQFDTIVDILDHPSLTEEERDVQLKLRYTMSQAHKNFIFELTDDFYQVFTAEAELSMQTTNQLLDDTVMLLIAAILIVLLLSTWVSIGFIRSFIGPIRLLQAAVRRVAQGDLSSRIHTKRTDELGSLSNSFDDMTEQMATMLSASWQIASTMKQLSASLEAETQLSSSAGLHILQAMEEISSGSDEQAALADRSMEGVTVLENNVLDIRSITDQMKGISQDTSVHTDQGMVSVEALNEVAWHTEERLLHMVDSLEILTKSSKEISKISTTIEEISQQTNLLAVNASIEAGHAGQHGKGFAVIATQVRELSDQTKESSRHIGSIIQQLQNQMTIVHQDLIATRHSIQQQNTAIKQTSDAFSIINNSTKLLAANMTDIHTQVNSAIDQNKAVITSFQTMIAVTEETAVGVQVVNSAVSEQDQAIRQIANQASIVNELAEQLFAHISLFKMNEISQ